MEEIERDFIAQAMARSGGRKSVAAPLLGICRDKLRYRLEKFGMQPEQ